MIETQRLIIRRYNPADWEDLYKYLSDPKMVLYEPYNEFTEDEWNIELK